MAITSDLSNLGALIDRHMKLREVQGKINEETGTEPATVGHWLTLSRQYGSGGTALAHRLSEQLDWDLFSREILQGIAANTNIRMRILSGMDGRVLGRFEEFIHHLVVPKTINQVAFVKEMMQVMLSVARRGNAILLGRGGNWLLPTGQGLRLRVVAPQEYRAQVISARLGIGEDRARDEIRTRDAATSRFISRTFGRNIDDPLGYDMILNLGEMPEEAAAEAVQAALKVISSDRSLLDRTG
jgi:cytidylate kinase